MQQGATVGFLGAAWHHDGPMIIKNGNLRLRCSHFVGCKAGYLLELDTEIIGLCGDCVVDVRRQLGEFSCDEHLAVPKGDAA